MSNVQDKGLSYLLDKEKTPVDIKKIKLDQFKIITDLVEVDICMRFQINQYLNERALVEVIFFGKKE